MTLAFADAEPIFVSVGLTFFFSFQINELFVRFQTLLLVSSSILMRNGI